LILVRTTWSVGESGHGRLGTMERVAMGDFLWVISNNFSKNPMQSHTTNTPSIFMSMPSHTTNTP